MTTRIILPRAAKDFDSIINFLEAKAGARVAVKYARLFDEYLGQLEAFPEMGAPQRVLGPFARVVVIAPYLLIYDYDRSTGVVSVLRILHGRRNITKQLLGS